MFYEVCPYITKTFEIPHLVVFANFEPDYAKSPGDRWDVRFTESDLYVYGNIENEFVFATTSAKVCGPRASTSTETPDINQRI